MALLAEDDVHMALIEQTAGERDWAGNQEQLPSKYGTHYCARCPYRVSSTAAGKVPRRWGYQWRRCQVKIGTYHG